MSSNDGVSAAEARHLARRFRQQVIEPLEPHRAEWTEPATARFPWAVIEEASRWGLRTLGTPRERGGLGADTRGLCAAAEELSRGDMGIAVALDQTWKCAETIELLGTPAQRDWFYERFVGDDRFLLAIGMTEPDNGSDKYIYPDGSMRTRAQAVDGGWEINGRKDYISNGSEASLILLYAVTDPAVPLDKAVTCFLVPADADGFRVGHVHDKISQRLVNNAELIAEGLRVPEDAVLGPPGRALARAGDSGDVKYVRGGNAGAAATTLGTALAAYDAAMAWAQTRVQGGRTIIEHQAVGFRLADMATRLEAARALVRETAEAVDSGSPDAPRLLSMAKAHAAEVAVRVCTDAMEIVAGRGIMRDCPVQKHLRDCLSFMHSDGTREVHLQRVLWQLRRGVGEQQEEVVS